MTKMHVRNIDGLPAVLDKFDDFAHQTVVRAMAEAGITVVAGSFEKGAVVTSSDEGVYQESTGKVYSWFTDATITVPAGTTPQNFGGVNATAWVDRTDVTLRSELNVVVKVFESVADMIADASLVVGQKCRTLGYYAVGDGGANDYEIVAAATGTDDGGSYIDLSGSGFQAKGLFGSVVNVRKFGAKGDGVTDDTAPFLAARAYSFNVHVPDSPGYLINQDITGNFYGYEDIKFTGSG